MKTRLPFASSILIYLLFMFLANPSIRLAAQEQQNFSSIVPHLPAKSTQLLAINQPYKHFMAAVESATIDAWLDGLGNDDFSSQIKNVIGDLRNQAPGFEPYFPKRIAIASDESLESAFTNAMESFLYITIAGTSDPEVFAEDFGTLQSRLSAAIHKFDLPNVTIWVDWEDKNVSKTIYSALETQIEDLMDEMELEFDIQDNRMEVDLKVSDIIQTEQIEFGAEMLGLTESSIAEGLSEKRIKVTIQRIDGAIQIQVGEFDENRMDRESIGEVFQDGDEQIVFVKWDFTQIKTWSNDFSLFLSDWKKSEIIKEFLMVDFDGMWSSLEELTRQIKSQPTRAEGRFWAEADSIQGMMKQFDLDTAITLESTGLSKWRQADFLLQMFDGTRSAASVVADSLMYFEERLATQILRSDIQGDSGAAGTMEDFSQFYYEEFADFRESLLERMPKIFDNGALVIVDGQGQIQELIIEWNVDGQYKSAYKESLTIPRFAIVGVCNSPDVFAPVSREVLEGLVAGYRAAMDPDAAFPELELTKNEAVLSCVCWEFPDEWIEHLGGAMKLRLQVEGDFNPHIFVHDGFATFSTSFELSEKLLGGLDNTQSPLPGEGDVIFLSSFKGELYSLMFETMFDVAFEVISEVYGVHGTDETEFDGLKSIFSIFSLLEVINWETKRSGDHATSDILIQFQATNR